MRRWLALGLPTAGIALAFGVAFACGEPLDPDAPADAGADTTAVDSGPKRCKSTASFDRSSVRPLDGINTSAGESGPRLSPDELTIVFQRIVTESDRQIRIAHRASLASSFEPDQEYVLYDDAGLPIDKAVGGQIGVDRTFTRIVVELVSPVDRDLFVAVPVDGGARIAERIEKITTPAQQTSPFVVANGESLLFANLPTPDAATYEIFRSPRSGDTFGSGTKIELGLGAQQFSPVASEDDLELFWSERIDVADRLPILRHATRARVNDTYGSIETLTTFEDGYVLPGWLSPDGCRLYFARAPAVGAEGYDLFVVNRSPE